jgi:hypothetical protein
MIMFLERMTAKTRELEPPDVGCYKRKKNADYIPRAHGRMAGWVIMGLKVKF